jgi:membrane protein YdbS with pleckstrin-like domain
MGYIERNLMPGEELLLAARYHWVRFLGGAVLFVAGLVVVAASFGFPASQLGTALLVGGSALAAIGLVVIGIRALRDAFDEFGVTSFRVFRKTGFLTRDVTQIPLDKIQDVNIKATLWGRWLSYGDVELQTASEDGLVRFPRVRDPEKFRNLLFTRLHAPAPASMVASVAAPARVSVEERLNELSRLRDKGLVSEDEYAEKRRTLLAEL